MQFKDLIYPVFQPVVDVNGAPIYYEANVRAYGQRTDDGHTRLLAVAEEMGFVDSLDCIICEAAIQAGFSAHSPVGVNVSAFTVQNALEEFLAAVKAARSLPRGIVVELTETVQPDRADLMERFVSEVRRTGARIAVDDYGTGHFEPRDVCAISPDFLKLAMPRVHAAMGDANARRWIADAVDLANQVGAQLIAEGIEDEATLHFLTRSGIRYFQGYLWGRPTHIIPQRLANFHYSHMATRGKVKVTA